MRRDLLIGAAALFIVCGHADATWKPEFATHSEALREWFRAAETTREWRTWRTSKGRSAWIGCCEQSERVHVKFRLADNNGDDWSYQCTAETKAACGDIPIGGWKQIPPMIVHNEPIKVPEPYDPDDPKIKLEFEQLRAEGVLFIAFGFETCFWPPQSGQ